MSKWTTQTSWLIQHAIWIHERTRTEAELFGASYLKLPWIFDHAVATITDLGIAAEREVRFLLLLLLAYVFGFTYRCLPSARARHAFSVYAGAALGQTFCGATGWFYPLMAALTSFQMIHLIGPSRAAPAVFGFNLVFLFVLHLHRQLTDPLGWHLDATFMQMIVTQKLSSLALSISDGSRKSPQSPSYPVRDTYAIRETPSLLEFLAFIFFPPCFLMGPTIEYLDWHRNAHDLPPPQLPDWQATEVIIEGGTQAARPGIRESAAASFSRLLQAVFFLVSYQVVNAKLSSESLADPGWLRIHRAGGVLSLYSQIWLSLLGLRCKYYFGFKIAEGAAIMSGVGFSAYAAPAAAATPRGTGIPQGTAVTGQPMRRTYPRFDRVSTVDVLGFEFANSIRDAAAAWNKPTNTWLRRCVYERLPRRYQLDLYGTYVVSAIWHGIAPGYYMFFVTSAFLTSLERQWRRFVRKVGLDQKLQQRTLLSPATWIVTWAWTTSRLNYFIISFVMLTSARSFRVWSALSWWGHKLLVLELIVAMMTKIIMNLIAVRSRGVQPRSKAETADGKTKK
jgi:D-alanyl-lipoteichoic acid acyltransferase DltB (MBOAT superfamily)